MDALSEVLHSVKLEGAVFYNAEFTAPWGFRSPPSREVAAFLHKAKHVIIYHLLIDGRAQTEVVESAQRIDLVPGDIVIFPHGSAHIISNGCPPCIIDNGKHLKEMFSQGMTLARAGGGGEPTRLVCGYLGCDQEVSRSFLGGLPPMFKINIRNDPAGQWLESSIQFRPEKRPRTGPAAMRCWRNCRKRFSSKPCAVHGGAPAAPDRLACGSARSGGGSCFGLPASCRSIPGRLRILPSRWECPARRWRRSSDTIWANPRWHISPDGDCSGARMLTSTSYSVARIAAK